MKKSSSRIWELDFLRGFAIIMVLVDHAMFDIFKLFSFWQNSGHAVLEFLNSAGKAYFTSEIRALWRPAFLFLFFCTSGLCTAFSKNNFYRGLRLAFAALIISVVTYYAQYVLEQDTFILFGVIHCLTLVILIFAAVSALVKGAVALFCRLIKKEYKEVYYNLALSIVCLALSGVFYFINRKYNVPLYEATSAFNVVDTTSKIAGLFVYTENWWTSDYFPLFPFIGFFFFGAGLTYFIYPKKKTLFPSLDGIWHSPFTFSGRHSLTIYLLGQIVMLSFFYLLSLALTGRGLN